MNKKLFICAVFALLLIASIGIANSKAQTAADQNALVNAADLTIAGFTDAKAVPAANGRYSGAYYFSVAEKAEATDSEAPNLILVSDERVNYIRTSLSFSYTATDKVFPITNGVGKEGTMPDGRTVIYFDKGKSYVVIIAPDKQKTEKLALLIASKISAD
ncbi:MAG: hypothetical protein PHE24_01420 [Patescibacteria group bacterium]|nr:hypothetical protein [Patescibacteria group bacterium]